LSAPERVFQLGGERFPPLKSLRQTNLPVPATQFLGRASELEEIVSRLERGDVRVDEAIELFRRGEEVYKACVARLQSAELRIEELSPDDRGRDTG